MHYALDCRWLMVKTIFVFFFIKKGLYDENIKKSISLFHILEKSKRKTNNKIEVILSDGRMPVLVEFMYDFKGIRN